MTEQQHYLKGASKFFLVVASAVFCMGFVGSWSYGAGLLLFLFGLPALAISLFVGAAVFSWKGLMLSRRAQLRRYAIGLAAPLMLVVTLAVSWPALLAGSYTGTWVRLMLNWHHYQSIISKAESQRMIQQDAAYQEDDGVRYAVDAGPPVRVAFNPAGILDNWSGIVFDPTHEVMLADGFDDTGKFRAPERVTKLFGGDLVGCRRLTHDFSYCSFT